MVWIKKIKIKPQCIENIDVKNIATLQPILKLFKIDWFFFVLGCITINFEAIISMIVHYI